MWNRTSKWSIRLPEWHPEEPTLSAYWAIAMEYGQNFPRTSTDEGEIEKRIYRRSRGARIGMVHSHLRHCGPELLDHMDRALSKISLKTPRTHPLIKLSEYHGTSWQYRYDCLHPLFVRVSVELREYLALARAAVARGESLDDTMNTPVPPVPSLQPAHRAIWTVFGEHLSNRVPEEGEEYRDIYEDIFSRFDELIEAAVQTLLRAYSAELLDEIERELSTISLEISLEHPMIKLLDEFFPNCRRSDVEHRFNWPYKYSAIHPLFIHFCAHLYARLPQARPARCVDDGRKYCSVPNPSAAVDG